MALEDAPTQNGGRYVSKRAVNLWLDSGAFSAWRRKDPIDLAEYIKFCHKHAEGFSGYINLDVIPGNPGTVRTNAHVEAAAEGSWKNLLVMRKEGLNPMPVYHLGERRYWLEKMLGEGFTHVGLGGFAKSHNAVRREWLDNVFGFLCGSAGYPSVCIHGFGMTSVPLIFRYPWYSVDSISWRLYAAYGWVLAPQRHADGTPDFMRGPLQIGVSLGSKSAPKHLDNLHRGVGTQSENALQQASLGKAHHIEGMGDNMRRACLDWWESEGFTLKEFRRIGYEELMRACVRYYVRVEENYELKPFKARTNSLFFKASSEYGQDEPIGKFRILYTINPIPYQSAMLQAEGRRSRLLSYYEFKDGTMFDLEEYMATGLMSKKFKRTAYTKRKAK